MNLSAYVDRYTLDHHVEPSTEEQLRVAARIFDRWSKDKGLHHVKPVDVSKFLQWRLKQGRKPDTVRGNRTSLLMLLRSAYGAGATKHKPDGVRSIKVPQSVIEGFDAKQMTKLIETARLFDGEFPRTCIARRIWLTSILLTYWDSALRLGDLLSIERSWIWPQPEGAGAFSIVQSKTGRTIARLLRPVTMKAIDECCSSGHPRRLIWPMWGQRQEFYKLFRDLAKRAGLTGTSKFIRRGSASEVEAINPGGGRSHLGHSTAGVFEKSYRVARIVQKSIPLPPEVAQ